MADREFYEEARRRAHDLYVNHGMSLRDIAARVLPDAKGGFVTVQRWSVKADPNSGLTWQLERDQLLSDQRAVDRQRYLNMIAEIKDRNLRIAAKASAAAELALDAYFELDEATGAIGVRKNRYGDPIISPTALAPLLNAIMDMQNKTLGYETLSQEDKQKVAVTETGTVEANRIDPERLKRLGDALALQALDSAPVPEPAADG